MKTSLTWEGKHTFKPRTCESSVQDKPKEEHTETHINQTDKDKEKILKATTAQQQVTYNGIAIRFSADFSAKLCRPEGSGTIYFK